MFGKNQPIALQLLGSDRSREALEGVAMELEDSLYPLLREVCLHAYMTHCCRWLTLACDSCSSSPFSTVPVRLVNMRVGSAPQTDACTRSEAELGSRNRCLNGVMVALYLCNLTAELLAAAAAAAGQHRHRPLRSVQGC